ncbi:MAG: HAD family phosphatase [Oscillatoriales cyanobacterium RM2_1_1]|nr:HAD family phosphatase [Oscillatoriales cyanobacterium SM2_3_0]NJO47954.1 HAD family phosphatase [Oscillatoriales cyanobacterium RM2_1_1]
MLKAILFDLDGTLVNTDPLHFQVWQDMLKEYQIDIDQSAYQARVSGRQNPQIIADLLPQLSEAEIAQFAEEKEARFRDIATTISPLGGVLGILNWLEANHLKTALVTNAPRNNAEFMLTALNLKERLKIVILGEEMIAGKPDPAPYQFCLQQLEIQASEAIVFEDSPSGIRSALGAGITTIGVATTHDPNALKALGVSRVIQDFNDQSLWEWLETLV